MKKFFGNKEFYKKVMMLAIPIIVQNMITNFVNLLDNIMVGAVGTEQMTGVSVVNQLTFVFSLALFGAVSGPGIFTAQYYGKKDYEGVRNTMRFKFIVSVVILVGGVSIFLLFGDDLIRRFMTDTEKLDVEATFGYAKEYLRIMLIGLIPFCFSNAYAGTLRETEKTTVPMIAGITATVINLGLNYILIFGHFGAPRLGVTGAAIATVVSRYVELLMIVLWSHLNKGKTPYFKGLYRSLAIPGDLIKKILLRGTPLFLNEFLWSLGMTELAQRYSTRGLEVVSAVNISNTFFNLFNVMVISMGSVVAIIIGNLLGANETDEAVDTDRKLIVFSVLTCTVFGALEVIFAPFFPLFYNTTDEIRGLAATLLRINGCCLPVHAFLNSAYFTLRSGGKTVVTFIFDSVFIMVVTLPVATVLARFTALPIVPLYICVQCTDMLKVVMGAVFLKKRIWINNLVDD
ncbi:MAG: MATE family efflux transporter [Lachnospiraceae bacterium]|nr:MATE family efflux transporter [Lachnospiraceae bacterium]